MADIFERGAGIPGMITDVPDAVSQAASAAGYRYMTERSGASGAMPAGALFGTSGPGDTMHYANNNTFINQMRSGEYATGVMSREIAFLVTEDAVDVEGATMGEVIGLGMLNIRLRAGGDATFADDATATGLLNAYRYIGVNSGNPPRDTEIIGGTRNIPVTVTGSGCFADVFVSLETEVEGECTRYYLLAVKMREASMDPVKPGVSTTRDFWQILPVAMTGAGPDGTNEPHPSTYTNSTSHAHPFYTGACIFVGTQSRIELEAPAYARPLQPHGIRKQQLLSVVPLSNTLEDRMSLYRLRVVTVLLSGEHVA